MKIRNYLLEKEQKIKIKASGKIGYILGPTKIRTNRKYYQILFPWTEEENKQFEDFWGKKRPKTDKGQKSWIPETSFTNI
jgi:hypothetical protein